MCRDPENYKKHNTMSYYTCTMYIFRFFVRIDSVFRRENLLSIQLQQNAECKRLL